MASPHPDGEIERSSECEEFVSRVINTRNYLTHYDQSLADNAYDGQELYELCEEIDALVQLNLLKAVEFQDEEIESVVMQAHSPLGRKLQL